MDVYQRVTDQIVTAIEAGAGKWSMPWHVSASDGSDPMPHNVSGRSYRGVNVLALWAVAQSRGYGSHTWATYRQWAERGAQVRKGETGATVVFWKFDAKATASDSEGDDSPRRRSVMARAYVVHNAAQVDGYTAPVAVPVVEPERDARCDAWFRATGADISHGGSRAFYQPSGDRIQMPPFDAFVSPRHYYATLAHEVVHWTGDAKRCARDLRGRFGDESYAAEELIAELGTAFQCALLRLDSEPREDHAAYIQSWLKVLKADKRAIFTAASKAQQAVDWIVARQPTADAEAVDALELAA